MPLSTQKLAVGKNTNSPTGDEVNKMLQPQAQCALASCLAEWVTISRSCQDTWHMSMSLYVKDRKPEVCVMHLGLSICIGESRTTHSREGLGALFTQN